jgi:hypothetical protein
MFNKVTLLTCILASISFASCDTGATSFKNVANDTTQSITSNNNNDKENKIDVAKRNLEESPVYPSPNSFLGLKIGLTKSSFFQQYPNAPEGSFWVVMTDIRAKGMDVYTIEKSTTSGDRVQIDCCFKNDKLAIISIEYKDYQSESEILTGLKAKYGAYSQRKTINWNDFTNQQDRTTTITTWEQSDCCILELDHTHEIGLTELIFADKQVQTRLAKEKELQDKNKIE